MKVSIVIPVYNEEKSIESCLRSISRQNLNDLEIIIIDDGSTDGTVKAIEKCRLQIANLELLKQNHGGPGSARNLGAKHAKGNILVLVDADMEFDREFLKKLISPIEEGKCIGTFSKEEYLLNRDSAYARCWNLNLGRSASEMVPRDYPDESPVFRAILKSKFLEVGGFETGLGYTDDWSISRKLGVKSTIAHGAILFHKNPESLTEVWNQARWFGKNEFLTKNLARRVYNLIRYFPLTALVKGIFGALFFKEQAYILFKPVYDTAVFVSVCMSFLGERKSK